MTRGAPLSILVHEWVTGGGLAGAPLPPSWAAEGSAMRRAIAADFAGISGVRTRVTVTMDARLPADPGPWETVRLGPGEYPDRVLELARKADFTVPIAPETMGILAELTRWLEQVEARSLGSTFQAIELTGDKARLSARFREHGIVTPETRIIVPADGLPGDAVYPAVLKPVDGAGAIDTYFVKDSAGLPDGARRLDRALLQPFISGIPMSASFLVGEGPRPWLLGVGRQRITIQDGMFHYRGGVLPVPCPGAEPMTRQAVALIPGLRGFVGVDFLWDSERREVCVLEINPRPTTSYVGLSRLLPGGRLAEAWLASCGGLVRDTRFIDELRELAGIGPSLVFDSDGTIRYADKGDRE